MVIAIKSESIFKISLGIIISEYELFNVLEIGVVIEKR